MKKIRLLILTYIILLPISVFCQHYYNISGHLIATQKGIVIQDSLGKKLGVIKGSTLYDTLGNGIAVVDDGGANSPYVPHIKHILHIKDNDIYDINNNNTMIGSIEGLKIYDISGDLLGYTDKKIMGSQAVLFYFYLYPLYNH